MVRRFSLGYLLALPLFVLSAARLSGGDRDFRLTVRLASSVGGVLQVYTDTGRGFSEPESYEATLTGDGQPHDYELKIPPGRYSMFRIDPGQVAGRYTLYGVTVSDAHGVPVARPLLAELQPLVHLNTVERTGEKLVMDTPPDPVDPQILWMPARRLELIQRTEVWDIALGTLLMAAGAFFAVVSLLAWLCVGASAWIERQSVALASAASRRPRAAIALAAGVGLLVSAYPVLFFGRSLLSPNNGGNRMLYEGMPFTPGSTDVEVENTRNSDVATGTWVFLPYSVIQRNAVLHGEFPLWNRENSGGRPLWGQGQSFLLDPLHWLTLVPRDAGWGLDLKFLAHRFVFALGVGLLAFAVTGSWLPSAIVAASVPFLGLYNYRFNHPQPFALTYAPWVLLGWLRLALTDTRVRASGAFVLAVATALVLYASPPKEAAISLLSAYGVGTVIVMMAPGSFRSRAMSLLWAVAAGVAAVLATAPDWLVFAGTLPQSETAYDNLIALFGGAPHALALFLGPVTSGEVLAGYSPLVLVGMVAALCAPRRLWSQRAVLASAVGAAVLLAMAFGAIPAQVVLRLPLISRITHFHDVCLTAAAPLVLVLTAFGLDELLSGGWLANSLVAAVSGGVAYKVILEAYRLAPPEAFEPLAAVAVLSAAAVLPLALVGARREGFSITRVANTVIALTVMLLAGGLHLETPFSALNVMLFQPRPRVDYTQHSPAVDEIRAVAEPGRTLGVDFALFPGSAGLYRLEALNGVDALQLPRYERLTDAAGLWRGWWYFVRAPADSLGPASKFLDLMNVRHVLAEPGQPVPGAARLHVPAGDRLELGERPSAWPRAFFVDGVSRYATLPEFIAQLNSSTGPFASIEASDDRAASATSGVGSTLRTVVPAESYVLTANTTAFHVRASSPGVAVLTESYLLDDFVVTLNGRAVPYFRVNHAFKAVAIPAAGEWDVRMEYRPKHWRLSLVLGLAGAVAIAGLCLWGMAPRTTLRASIT